MVLKRSGLSDLKTKYYEKNNFTCEHNYVSMKSKLKYLYLMHCYVLIAQKNNQTKAYYFIPRFYKQTKTEWYHLFKRISSFHFTCMIFIYLMSYEKHILISLYLKMFTVRKYHHIHKNRNQNKNLTYMVIFHSESHTFDFLYSLEHWFNNWVYFLFIL